MPHLLGDDVDAIVSAMNDECVGDDCSSMFAVQGVHARAATVRKLTQYSAGSVTGFATDVQSLIPPPSLSLAAQFLYDAFLQNVT